MFTYVWMYMDRCISFFSDMKGGNPCMYVKMYIVINLQKYKYTQALYIYYVEQWWSM